MSPATAQRLSAVSIGVLYPLAGFTIAVGTFMAATDDPAGPIVAVLGFLLGLVPITIAWIRPGRQTAVQPVSGPPASPGPRYPSEGSYGALGRRPVPRAGIPGQGYPATAAWSAIPLDS